MSNEEEYSKFRRFGITGRISGFDFSGGFGSKRLPRKKKKKNRKMLLKKIAEYRKHTAPKGKSIELNWNTK